jgi:hypothetical protein
MTSLGALRTANLLVADIGRSARPSPAEARADPTDALTAAAAGSSLRASGVRAQDDSIFSVNHVDANELKINLFERVGKAFGLDLEDFADAGEMAGAVRSILSNMSPDATNSLVKALEKELGLDDLGISFGEVLDAMTEPGGKSDQKLTDALREEAGEAPVQGTSFAGGSGMRFDGIGLYSP